MYEKRQAYFHRDREGAIHEKSFVSVNLLLKIRRKLYVEYFNTYLKASFFLFHNLLSFVELCSFYFLNTLWNTENLYEDSCSKYKTIWLKNSLEIEKTKSI